MEITVTFQTDDTGVDYQQVATLLYHYGLTDISPEQIQQAFKNSYAVIFVKDATGQVVGVGRAISDGVIQGAIYNIALQETFHHQGIGRGIIQGLLDQMPEMIVTLYTHPKTIDYYKSLGLAQLKTAFVRFRPHEVDEMIQEKFIDGM